MAAQTKVSVLVPTYNAEPYLAASLESILMEKTVPLEVIVIDDRSTDGSRRIALGMGDERIKIAEGPGRGLSACLNAGVAAATGEVIMRCDSDDLYPPGRIQRMLKCLEDHPQFDAVCGGFSTIDQAGHLVADLQSGDREEEVTDELNNGITRTTLCSYAIRKAAYLRIGFREEVLCAEDIDFQLRLGEIARVLYLPGCTYLYRLHETSATHTYSAARREHYEALARQFQIQRKTLGQDDLQAGRPLPPEPEMDAPSTAAQQIGGMLLGAAWREHAKGNRGGAIALGLKALRRFPGRLDVWRSLVALLVKPRR